MKITPKRDSSGKTAGSVGEEDLMPRMSKKRKEEWSFFLNDKKRIVYNALCRQCVRACKQSHGVIVVQCRKYLSKRAVGEVMLD